MANDLLSKLVAIATILVNKSDFIYQCNNCKSTFTSFDFLREHIKPTNCCQKSKPIKMRSHLSKEFMAAGSMFFNKNNFTSECNECHSTLTSIDFFMAHLAPKSPCRKKSLTKLRNYIEDDSDSDMVIPDQSDEDSKRNDQSRTVKEQKLPCRVCDVSLYKSKEGLWQHEYYKHQEEFPHRCAMCRRAFTNNEELINHEQSHDDKKVECDFCPEILRSEFEKENHIKKIHPKGQYHCERCKYKANKKLNLRRHMVAFHGEIKPIKIKVSEINGKKIYCSNRK